MAQWNNEIDGPPPSMLARRFSEKLGDAIDAFNAKPGPSGSAGILAALGAFDDYEHIDALLGERRKRIALLLTELDGEFRDLADEISFRQWRRNPTGVFRRARLLVSTGSLRPKGTVQVGEMLLDLLGVAESENGVFGRPVRRGPGLVAMQVPDYVTSAPGTEGSDVSGRVRSSAGVAS